MSEHSDEQGTDEGGSSVEVPNITDNARSGLEHERLTPRKSTLVGSARPSRDESDEGLSVSDGPVYEPHDPANPEHEGDKGIELDGGEVTEQSEVGTDGEASGDGSGEPAPEVEQTGGAHLGPGLDAAAAEQSGNDGEQPQG